VIANPLDANESVLRTALRPGLLKTIAYNESHRRSGAAIFEIGTVFLRDGGAAPLPAEPERLAVALAGNEAPEAVRIWRALGDALGVAVGVRNDAGAGLHPGRSGAALVAGLPVGVLGEIDPAVAEAFGVNERVAFLEIDIVPLLAARGERTYAPASRFPSSDIDLAFTVADEVPVDELAEVLRFTAGELVVGLELFDVYRGAGVPEGSRSLAFALRLQATDRTLTDDEVAQVRSTIVEAAKAAGATLR
jgi:phenylalanyl-tRNA synthetase beta chain